jgi:PAS domain S-box-containing protein
MKKYILILLLLVSSAFASNIKVKNIILLHTYDYQYPWTKSLFEGMNILQKESPIPIKFYTEQIDFKKIKLKNKKEWEAYFSNKYRAIPIDGVVVVFGNAIKFINEYGNTIFKNIPKVVYGDTDIEEKKDTIFLRVENSLAVRKTVQVALLQNKNVKNIYILGNEGEITEHLTTLTKQYVKEYSSLIPKTISNLTTDEVKDTLSKLPKDSIVFYTLFFTDKNGIKLSPKIYLEKFSKISSAPIYSYYSVLLKTGTIGGYVIDSNLLMQNMVKALIGEKKHIKNKTYSIQAIFDYDALVKFNINTEEIPDDALIINNPINYFKIYKVDILIITLCILFILFIITLFINSKRKKKLIKELKIKNKLLNMKEEFNSFFQLSINLQIIANINNGKIVQINNASKSILGYEAKELIDTTFLNLVHPDDLEATINEMNKLKKGEVVYLFENRLTHKNGSCINLAWSATTNPKNKLIYATAQNVTQSKVLELEKKEKEKIFYQQSKLAAMGEMIGNIAHQWRQPLSTITTASTGAKLQKEMDCLSDSQLNSTLDVINNSAQYLSQTIDDFRGFFNPNNNKINKFNIIDTFNKTLNLIDAQFTAKNIEIIKNFENFELLTIENELIQVLINILNNARDILITKEKLRRLVFINTYHKENVLYIEIIDNAGGINNDIIERVFEPYFTTKHQSQGTGIGLYMSEEIIRNHLNGTILVENTSYKYNNIDYIGAKFTIKINTKNV